MNYPEELQLRLAEAKERFDFTKATGTLGVVAGGMCALVGEPGAAIGVTVASGFFLFGALYYSRQITKTEKDIKNFNEVIRLGTESLRKK